jgi:hypothetical protein
MKTKHKKKTSDCFFLNGSDWSLSSKTVSNISNLRVGICSFQVKVYRGFTEREVT